MALRRRQGGIGRSSTFKEEKTYRPPPEEKGPPPTHSSSSSLPAQANMSSSNHRDSSHSSSSSFKDHHYKGGPTYDYTSMEGSNEAGSFWGVLARKAKAILDDDNSVPYQSEYPTLTRPEPVQPSRQVRPETVNITRQVRPETANPSRPVHQGENSTKNNDNPTLRKGLVALTTSMSRIGDSLGNALEEGRTIVENKTSDFMEETRNNIQIRRKGVTTISTQNHTSQEDLLKASRDVAMATAAKTKLLLRELKTVKADLAFARQRCSQLEEENRALVEGHEKGIFPGDDDMIRLQLETLLAEKARLAHENSVYECENRFLREIVEYHQLTMQDIVYLDEGIEEVTEVYDYPTVQSGRVLSGSPPVSPAARRNSFSSSLSRSSSVAKEMLSLSSAPREKKNINNDTPSA